MCLRHTAARLADQLGGGPSWRVPGHHDDGDALLQAAKRVDSTYRPGGRTKNWVTMRLRG